MNFVSASWSGVLQSLVPNQSSAAGMVGMAVSYTLSQSLAVHQPEARIGCFVTNYKQNMVVDRESCSDMPAEASRNPDCDNSVVKWVR